MSLFADIAFGPWGFVLAFWPVILIGVIIIAVVILVKSLNNRNSRREDQGGPEDEKD